MDILNQITIVSTAASGTNIFDQITNLSNQALTAIRAVVTVVVIVVFLWFCSKRQWAVGSIIAGGLIGAAVLFLTFGGFALIQGFFAPTLA